MDVLMVIVYGFDLLRSNPAPKTFIAFKLGEFGMLLHVTKADHKVNIALKVKKEIDTPAVGKRETMEVVGKMYAITHNALNEPTIKPMVGERVCDNKVLVLQSVLDKAKENGNRIDESMLTGGRDGLTGTGPTVADMKYKALMGDPLSPVPNKKDLMAEVAKELNELTQFNPTELDELKAGIETMIAALPDPQPSYETTLQQLRSEMEQKLAAHPDATGKSFDELAFLEIHEQLERMRAQHVAKTCKPANGPQ